MDIDLLRTQHQEISDTGRQLRTAVGCQTQPDGVGQLRWQLARQLMAHLALEDQFLYPLIQRSHDQALRQQAAQLQSDTGWIADTFGTYMRHWNEDRIAREWPIFCDETRSLLKALEERMHREDHGLYPAAEKAIARSSIRSAA